MSNFFIKRPIVAMVIAILTVIVGAVSIARLPVSQFPNIVPPEIQLLATYVGADAQTLEQSVATPIEQQINGVDKMNYMYSLNATGNSQTTIIVNFDVSTDPNNDLILTQSRQTQAASQLPVDVNNYGVTVQKSATAPLMLVGLYSPKGSRNAEFLANYAYINLNDPIGRLPGVGHAQVFGAAQYAMRLWVKPDHLAELGITVADIVNAIQSQNTVNPAGQIGGNPAPKDQKFTYSVLAQGRLTSPEQFGNIVVRAAPNGGVVRVKDVARVELGAQDYSMISRLNGKPCAVVAVYQLPGSNAVETAAAVRTLMAQMKQRLPQDVEYTIALDQTSAVTEGMKEIVQTLLIAIVLVIIVVYLFLQDWRSTLIPLLAVPVSLVGTFVFFPLFGFSINTLSMFGLVLAIGLVVDDAIVVVEGVQRHIEEGLSSKDAARKAMEELSGPVIGIALVLSSVFVPTAFIPGITGRLYQQFAVTIAISVLLSAFNALTLSPALAALLLRPKTESRGLLQRVFNVFNRIFERATNGYVHWSGALLRKGVLTVGLLAAAVAAGVFFAGRVPSSFLPDEDQGYLYVNMQLPNSASIERTAEAAEQVEKILADTPGVEYTTSVIGFSLLSFVRTSYNGFFFVTLKPWDERTTQGGTVSGNQGSLESEIEHAAGRRGFQLLATRDPWRRHVRRISIRARRPCRTRRSVLGGQPEQVPGSSPKAAGDWLDLHDVPAARATKVRRCRSGQGAEAGRGGERRLPDHPGLHGRPVHQLLQRFRPSMASLCRGRGRLQVERGQSRPVLRPQQPGRHGSACRHWRPSHRAKARNSPCATTNTARRRSTAARPLAIARTRQRPHWKKSSNRPCPMKWASTIWECLIKSRRPGKECRPGSSSRSRWFSFS